LSTKMLEAFAKWFASGAGVWQTFLVSLAVVAAEFIWPNMDPNKYWVLFWFTIYSGVTQPALAYVAVQSEAAREAEQAQTDSILHHLEGMLRRGVQLDEGALTVLRSIAEDKRD
jgi:hypothetical protein